MRVLPFWPFFSVPKMSLVPYNGSRSSRFLGPRFCHPSFNFQDGWKNWSGESVSRRSLFTLSPPHLTGHWPLCSTQHLTFHGRSGYYFSLLQSPQSFCKQEIQNNVALVTNLIPSAFKNTRLLDLPGQRSPSLVAGKSSPLSETRI